MTRTIIVTPILYLNNGAGFNLRPISPVESQNPIAYDGNGDRVQKVVSGTTTNYLYDAFGNLAAEYTTTAPAVSGTEYRMGGRDGIATNLIRSGFQM